MKFSAFLLPTLLCAASASAQYFSAGWTPGQAAPPQEAAYNFDPSANPPPVEPAASEDGAPRKLGIMDKVLLSAPVSSVFSKFGVNISDVVSRGAVSPWDERIPFITDENFEEVIVNEPLTEQEEKDRLWFIVISVTNSQNNAISKMVDKAFDDAYNETLIAGDLPNVRWGRIDYMNVTYLTTRWGIWTGPWLLVATDRLQSLRFYKASGIKLTPELMRDLLTEEIWRDSPIWSSNFAPGGKREWILHYFAYVLMKFYNVINRVPRFLLMILSGTFASFVMRLMHSWSPPAEPQAAPAPAPAASTSSTKSASGTKSTSSAKTETVVSKSDVGSTSTATSSPSKKAKQRKAGKK